MIDKNEVNEQSKSAVRQWWPLWVENAKKNGEKYRAEGRNHKDLLFSGVGKNLICVALSPSLEYEIEKLKTLDRDAVDIACVDKAFAVLMDHGVMPNYVIIADAIVDFSWVGAHLDATSGVTLIANITSNIDWTFGWKGPVFFYVNKDNIETEKELMAVSGCKELIPASSNVGNSVVVFCTQVMGYDRYFLIGYDFGWTADSNYYAFKDSDKRYWMKHLVTVSRSGKFLDTSQNLHFSCRWLADYYVGMCQPNKIQVYNCSKDTYCQLPYLNFDRALQIAKRRKITNAEKQKIAGAFVTTASIPGEKLNEIGWDQVKSGGNIAAVIFQYIKPEKIQWLESI